MSTETEIKYALDGTVLAERVLRDERVTQYLKDNWKSCEVTDIFYDTPDWDLAGKNMMLRVRTVAGVSVGSLKCGGYAGNDFAGLYRGSKYICNFTDVNSLPSDLTARGAPEIITDIAKHGLTQAFSVRFTRRMAILYMPEMTRAELCVDSGIIAVQDKTEPLCEMTFELLFGGLSGLEIYCGNLAADHKLEPRLLTKQQLALRLLRSR